MSRRAGFSKIRQPLFLRAAGPLLCVLALFYLGFHAVSGERGVLALLRETHALETLTAELAKVKAERETLDHKVKLLSSDSLDLDMLDEQARRVLGMADKNEVVLFLSDSSP